MENKTLEAKVGCKAVMKDGFRMCSQKPSERNCASQKSSVITYEEGKLVSTYICVDRKYK